MSLAELITNQREWEANRGIVNGHFGLDRLQAEVDEAYEAKTEKELLEELVDVQVILAGSVARLLKHLGIRDDMFEEMVWDKVQINELKYPKEVFEKLEMEAAVSLCRAAWRLKE